MKRVSLDNGDKGDKGFTILEVLIAVVVLSIGILAVSSLMGTSIKSSSYSQALTQANNYAQERLETLMSISYSNLQVSASTGRADLQRNCAQTDFTASRPVYLCTPTATRDIGSRTFSWVYEVIYIDLDGSGTASPGIDGLKRLNVTVSWSDQLWKATKSTTVKSMRS